MRKNIYIIILLVILLMITFVDSSKNISKNFYTKKDSQTDVDVYDYFTNKITDINYLINNEIYGYVYFGRDTCPNCLYINKFLEEEFVKHEDLLIYKFDTDYWRNDENFSNVLNKYNVSTIPTLLRINNDKSYETLVLNSIEEDIEENLNDFLYNGQPQQNADLQR